MFVHAMLSDPQQVNMFLQLFVFVLSVLLVSHWRKKITRRQKVAKSPLKTQQAAISSGRSAVKQEKCKVLNVQHATYNDDIVMRKVLLVMLLYALNPKRV